MTVHNIAAHVEDEKVLVSWNSEATDRSFMLKLYRVSPAHHDEIYLNTRITRYSDEPPGNATYLYHVVEFDNRGKEIDRTNTVEIKMPRGKDQLVKRVEELEKNLVTISHRLAQVEAHPIPKIGGAPIPSQLETHRINVINAGE